MSKEGEPNYTPPALHDLWPDVDPQRVFEVMKTPEFSEGGAKLRAMRSRLSQAGQLSDQAYEELEQAILSRQAKLFGMGFTPSELAAAVSASLGTLRVPPIKPKRPR